MDVIRWLDSPEYIAAVAAARERLAPVFDPSITARDLLNREP
jgi:hypothetical protein